MIQLEAEITEIASPPNKADQFRELTLWLPESEEHVEMTVALTEFQSAGFSEGDKISIKLEKKFDIDSLTQDLMNM
ncbi:MAG: hypothetical protein NPINA01_27330 [Nitrospinaceae bacterium]|nr:MAG: hypothetical protein NPINA01_27330 [Nitrospinaceae bacterium]